MNRKKRRKRRQMRMAAVVGSVLVVVVGAILAVTIVLKDNGIIGNSSKKGSSKEVAEGSEKGGASASSKVRKQTIEEADLLATQYDYDAAAEKIKTIDGYENDEELLEKIQSYEDTKASCKAVNMDEVTHIFYHSLVVDPERCFANQDTDSQAVGNNQWMTTISEFNEITQEMYDKGYVLVSIHDLYVETTNEAGETVYSPATILLPEGKKAYVLSQDDLSYYHSYDNYGYASKMIVGDDGKPTCEYIDADGNTQVGAYDVIPLMDQFLEEHPDASYRGAKGIIALTGYNGILGYRTDESYRQITSDLNADKKKWIQEHPNVSIDEEREEAKEVADAIKADGWEFASHTWGHVKVGNVSLESLVTDTEKWKKNVEPLVGETDTIIFAHGQDLGNWGNYEDSNEKYQYLRSQGFNIFCNVDSNLYRLWFGKDYIRMGRRNLDGYRIYYNAIGEQDNVSDLFDAKKVLDPLRPAVKPL